MEGSLRAARVGVPGQVDPAEEPADPVVPYPVLMGARLVREQVRAALR